MAVVYFKMAWYHLKYFVITVLVLSKAGQIQYGGCFSGRRTLDKATRNLLATEKKLSSKAVNGHVFLASNTCHHVLGSILIRTGSNEHCTTTRRPVLFNARKE